jgi:hypothetical protein
MPNTLADNLQRLKDSRTSIGNAIIAKGGTVNAGDGFEDFPADISTIPSGGSSTLIPKTITTNGTYDPSDDNADGYSSVVANVPNTYVAGDEGKVVNNGTLVAQTAMPNEITVNDTYDTTLYDSITVNVPSSPTPTPTPKPGLVRFMDYDGTILHTYTANEFLALSAMPENPTHEGLTSQGWNWSFEDAVAYVTTNRNLDIGQSYVTNDGRTRIYISLENPDLISPTLGLYLGGNSSVDVDWGDGSEHETMTRDTGYSGKVTAQHTYPSVGNYVISFAVIKGTCSIGGSSTQSHLLTDNKTSSLSNDAAYMLSIKKVEIGNDMSSVNDNAFRELRSLETITLPVNFYDFHACTFQNCYSLKAVVIPKNSSFTIGQKGYVFHNCQSLTNVSLSKESYICGYMFVNCYNLTRITIPLGRTMIGDGSSGYNSSSFNSCYNLSDVTIPEGITDINNATFYQCNLIGELELPASLTSIGISAFYNCRNLNSVVFENGTSDLTIGSLAFSGCAALDTIKLPTNLKTIGSNGFTGCSSLKEMDIPDSVTSIGAELCKDCGSLVSIKIGSGIATLPSGCFRSCISLTAVDIPVTVKTMNERVFCDCKTLKTITLHDGLQEITGGSVFENCQSLESIEFPDSVTTINGGSLLSGCTILKHAKLPKSLTTFNPGYTFNHCYLLTSFTIPETIATTPTSFNGIFGDCWSLTSIDIPSWLTTIGSSAISACYSLTELTIPSTVTLIDQYGISSPGALKRLRFVSSNPPTVKSASLSSIPTDCAILVPYGALTAYTTASYYPNPSTYSYIEYATYPSGDTLPDSDTEYSLTWYATIDDWRNETNQITVGNGGEIYVKRVAL